MSSAWSCTCLGWFKWLTRLRHGVRGAQDGEDGECIVNDACGCLGYRWWKASAWVLCARIQYQSILPSRKFVKKNWCFAMLAINLKELQLIVLSLYFPSSSPFSYLLFADQHKTYCSRTDIYFFSYFPTLPSLSS